MNKRGISLVIAWVLLIGMSVALAVLVTTWTKQYTKTATQSFLETTTGDLRCQDMAIAVNFTTGRCQDSKISITNKGYITAQDFIVRIDNQPFALASGVNRSIMPDQSKDLNIPIQPNSKIEILPIVSIDEGKRIACADRKFTLSC